VVALGFTLATGVSGFLNLLYQRFTAGGPVIHFETMKSVPVLLGLPTGLPK
jgi:ABC-type branched-subunit amino acid transport system permease subunit